MIQRAKTVGVCVSDQDRALDFYTDILGFEKRADEPVGPETQWIEVAPAGAGTRLVLEPGLEARNGTGRVYSSTATTSGTPMRSCAGVAWSSPKSPPNIHGGCGRGSKTRTATDSAWSNRRVRSNALPCNRVV